MINRQANIEEFRMEVRSWVEENCPMSVRDPLLGEEQRFQGGDFPYCDEGHKLWHERGLEVGFLAPTVPAAFGGGGYNAEQGAVIEEEILRVNAIPPLSGNGLTMMTPAVLKYGSEEIKQRFVPPSVRGELCWCQGFSEPGSGSDLASLKLRADEDGDDYILNGSKIWTTFAHHADWMFALVRTSTEHKQKGITFLLLDMKTPDIEVVPIRMISGNSVFNEVFFTDVRVPRTNVVGEVNQGWTVAKYLMQHERDAIGEFAFTGGVELADIARRSGLIVEGRIYPPQLRAELAEFEIDSWAVDGTLQRYRNLAESGQEIGAYSSVLKYCGTRLMVDRSDLVVSLSGYEGVNWDPEDSGNDPDTPSRNWLLTKGTTILGGTSEIQLNIISKAILQLPS